jgi:AcrR family transcriptional regulator
MSSNDSTTSVGSSPAQLSSHDRILKAAKHLFARSGYENTSTVAIARDAGTSESQLMKHFGSKQGLLSAILDRGWLRIAERLGAAQRTSSPGDRLLAILEAVAIELENDAELKDLMMLESRRVRKDSTEVLMSDGFRKFSDGVQEILVEMRNDGMIRTDVNLDAARAAYIGMVEGMMRDQVVAKRSEFHASYGLDDVRKVLEIIVPAFSDATLQKQ